MTNFRQRIRLINSVWPYFKKFKVQLLVIFVLKLSLIIPELLYPIVYREFIDHVMLGGEIILFIKVVVFYIGLHLLETFFKIAHRYFDNYLFNKISLDLRSIMFNKYLYMPNSIYSKFVSSDLKNRIDSDVDMTKIFILEQFFNYAMVVAKFISSATILFMFDCRIALFSLAMLPLSLILSTCFDKTLSKNYEDSKCIRNLLEQNIQETIHNWKEIKGNNLQEWSSKRFNDLLKQNFEKNHTITNTLIKRNTIIELKDSLLNQMILYVFGGILYILDKTTMSIVVMGIQYYNNMYVSISTILKLDAGLENLKPSISRVTEILSMENFDKLSAKERDFKSDIAISLENTSFKFPETENYILRRVNMNIKHRDKVLIIGESGAGKSTLINMLLGNLQPTEGNIMVYNNSVISLSQQELFHTIAAIEQEPYFMNLSIREYMKLANPNASNQTIENACKITGVLDYINHLPDGFDTMLGEHGAKFSGGQKQRLSLARLLLTDKSIIILDEAFSAIDGQDKITILKEILNRFNKKTIICISHDETVTTLFENKYCIKSGEVTNACVL